MKVELGIFPVSKHSVLPVYGTTHSACFDLSARLFDVKEVKVFNSENDSYKLAVAKCSRIEDGNQVVNYSVILRPFERMLVPCGYIFDTPIGHSVRLHPRSGLSLKRGIALGNCEGVIDADFPHETMMMLVNNSNESICISHGDRVCQAEIVEDIRAEFKVLDKKPELKSERTDGFGHTGVETK